MSGFEKDESPKKSWADDESVESLVKRDRSETLESNFSAADMEAVAEDVLEEEDGSDNEASETNDAELTAMDGGDFVAEVSKEKKKKVEKSKAMTKKEKEEAE